MNWRKKASSSHWQGRLFRLTSISFTTKIPARLSRNRISDYLPQRRQGRKGRRKHVKIFRKNICLFPPNLASLRLCGSRVFSGSEVRNTNRNFAYFRLVLRRCFYPVCCSLRISSMRKRSVRSERKCIRAFRLSMSWELIARWARTSWMAACALAASRSSTPIKDLYG